MRDYLSIGSSPCDEDCLQVGQAANAEMIAECRRFIDFIRKHLGPEPEGARLSVKRFEHDLFPQPCLRRLSLSF